MSSTLTTRVLLGCGVAVAVAVAGVVLWRYRPLPFVVSEAPPSPTATEKPPSRRMRGSVLLLVTRPLRTSLTSSPAGRVLHRHLHEQRRQVLPLGHLAHLLLRRPRLEPLRRVEQLRQLLGTV